MPAPYIGVGIVRALVMAVGTNLGHLAKYVSLEARFRKLGETGT